MKLQRNVGVRLTKYDTNSYTHITAQRRMMGTKKTHINVNKAE